MLVYTKDCMTFAVSDQVAKRCGTLAKAMDAMNAMDAMDAMASDEIVPVPNVTAPVVSDVVRYYHKLIDMDLLGAPIEAKASFKASYFSSMERQRLFDVMEAANYLDAEALLDDAAAYVADQITGKSCQEMRDFFGLAPDMTAEESLQVAREFAWAFH